MQKFKKLYFMIACLFLPLLAWATDPVTYYMRTDGNDANSGLTNNAAGAWKTFSPYNAKSLTAGDALVIGEGTFGANQNDTLLIIPSSGTAAARINISGLGADKTVIDASASKSVWGTGTGWVSYAANIWYHLLAKDDSVYACWNNGVLMTRVMTAATLTANNNWMVSTAAGALIDTLKVWFTADADTANVTRSKSFTVTQNGKSYITIQDMNILNGTGGVVSNMYDIKILNGYNVTVQRCKFPSSRFYTIYTLDCKFTTVSYCEIINSPRGIYARSDSGYFYNNTLSGGTYQFYLDTGKTQWTIRNNIFSLATGSLISIPAAAIFTASNNDYYNTNTDKLWWRGDTHFTTLVSWQDSTGQDANSITGDPRFKSSALNDYSLDWRSPAIDTGIYIAGVSGNDIDGILYDRKVPMGAYNFWQPVIGVKTPVYAPKHVAPVYKGW